MADGEDAAAHGLGDERCRIDREAEEERDELGREIEAAAEVEAVEDRRIERDGCSGDHPGERRKEDDDGERGEKDRKAPAGLLQPPLGPVADGEGGRDGDRKGDPDPQHRRARHRIGDEEATLVDVDVEGKLQRVLDGRHGLEDGEVPKEELEQQRDVPDRLDVDRRQRGDQEVLTRGARRRW